MRHLLLTFALCLALVAPALAVTIAEDWDCADGAITNAAPKCDQTWQEFGTTTNAWEVQGNVARYNASGADDAAMYVDTDLTTSHYVQAKVSIGTHEATKLEIVGVTCRQTGSGAHTNYAWEVWRSDAVNEHRLYQRTAGAEELLGTDPTDLVNGTLLRLECRTSGGNAVLNAFIGGTPASFGTITDTTSPHTTQTRAGVFSFFNGAVTSTITINDWEAGDLPAAGGMKARKKVRF